MAADYSRVRFSAPLNYSGVELKQGAVLLDADANESMAIVDRRLRALASDVLGRARVSSTTPDAFKIALSGTGLLIGKGRMYVDGLLAENHGAGAAGFDPLMGEGNRADAIDYGAQPYLPSPPPLPGQGSHIIYLDVWNRSVSHLEQPDLTEVAVGVETSSRQQTVWQVRALDEAMASDATCETAAPAWDLLTAPSSCVLTTGTFDIATVDDPCELPPTGGYRGLENQLYRVEIHSPSQAGAGATFKWSRENASVGSRVARWVSDKELELETLGRDDVLRFNTGDWVEVIDDSCEFALRAGEMRRITVDEATRRISFADALPASMLPPAAGPGASNLRVILWNQRGKVFRTDPSGTPVQVDDLDAGQSGTIAVPAPGTTLLLEQGITVAFDSNGPAVFRAGDYWVFAARTADASVERLERAPPRGIQHHYARLALWNVGNQAISDCRQGWPPDAGGEDCACTICVKPRDAWALQDAVEKVRAAGGGTICLDVGIYELEAPVVVANVKSLRIIGKGSATVLRCVRGPGVMRLEEKCQDIVLAAFCMEMGEVGTPQGILRIADSERIGLDRLALRGPLGDVSALELAGEVVDLWMHDCSVTSRFGIRAPRGASLADLRVDDNMFICEGGAIDVDGQSKHLRLTRMRGNRIECAKATAIVMAGRHDGHASIDIEANNILAMNGIEAALGRLRIANNSLQGPRSGGRFAIFLPDAQGVADLMIIGNRVASFDDAIVIKTSIQDAMIKQNQIDAPVNAISISGPEISRLSIENNQVSVRKGVALQIKTRSGLLAIVGNQMEGKNRGTLVNIDGESAACTFHGNQLDVVHAADLPAVQLKSGSLVVTSNRVRAETDGVSLQVESHVFTLLGNITRGEIKPMSNPWAPLNLKGMPN